MGIGQQPGCPDQFFQRDAGYAVCAGRYLLVVPLPVLGYFCFCGQAVIKKTAYFGRGGGGNGYTTLQMQEKGYRIALLEPSYAACQNAKDRGISTVICGALSYETMKDGSVPQFLLLDVLEHIEDDVGFLKLMGQKLAPGGKILLTVPAFQALWSSEDAEAGHYRRYTARQVKEAAAKAGFAVAYAGYFFGFLFFPILLVRVGFEKAGILKKSGERTEEEKREIGRKQFQERKGLVQAVLSMLERWELHKLIKNRKVHFGSSIICVLEKL